jgi:hypothetical protein
MPQTIISIARPTRRTSRNRGVNTTPPATRATNYGWTRLHGGDGDQSATRAALRRELLSLPFSDFAKGVVCPLLEKMGYQDVRPVAARRPKGISKSSGYDLTAFLPAGPYRRPVIIALKQFDTEPVYQRMADELRGVCLRVGASDAVLVTTSTLATTVKRDQMQHAPLAPVRFLDGEALLDLLIEHRIGVKQGVRNGSGELSLDHAFFDRLRTATGTVSAGGNRRGSSSGPECRTSKSDCGDPSVVVRVTVEASLPPRNRRPA